MRKAILGLVCLTFHLVSPLLYADSSIKIISPAFQPQESIPSKYTCQGADVSPQLTWTGIPKKTFSLVLIMEDPDASVGIWDHWVLYNLPPMIKGMPENMPRMERLANGERQGLNSFKKIGYQGPCPPAGKAHRYFFRIYALDAALSLQGKVTKDEVLKAMEGHILSSGELMGWYERKPN